jgi:hypothetical protein
VIPKNGSTDPVYGPLFGAPYGIGDQASAASGNASLQLTVLQKFGGCYNIRIDYQRIASLNDVLVDFVLDAATFVQRFAPFKFRSPGPWRNPRAPMPIGPDA